MEMCFRGIFGKQMQQDMNEKRTWITSPQTAIDRRVVMGAMWVRIEADQNRYDAGQNGQNRTRHVLNPVDYPSNLSLEFYQIEVDRAHLKNWFFPSRPSKIEQQKWKNRKMKMEKIELWNGRL